LSKTIEGVGCCWFLYNKKTDSFVIKATEETFYPDIHYDSELVPLLTYFVSSENESENAKSSSLFMPALYSHLGNIINWSKVDERLAIAKNEKEFNF